MKNTIMFLLAAILFMVPAQTAMASEMPNMNKESLENVGSMEDVPTLEMIDNQDGTFSVTAINCDGNVIFTEQNVAGNADEIIEGVYKSVYNDYAGKVKGSCTHIPCNHEIVWGGINHIIDGDTCIMVRSQFYKCKCCGEIIGMVSDSTVIVGTHAAH